MTLNPSPHRDIAGGQLDCDRTRYLSPTILARLVECCPDAMLVTDGHGEIVWANVQTQRMFGYTRDELLGQSVEILLPDRLREILPAYRKAFAVEPGILRTGEGLELDGRRKDGTDFPVDITLSLVENDDERAIVLAVIRDISKRTRAEKVVRENEERFRAILENSPNLIFLKDLEGRYLLVNKEFQRVFHITQAQIEGKKDEGVFPAEQAAAFRNHDLQVIQGGLPLEYEEVALHDDGLHTSIVQKLPLRDEYGKLCGTAGIVTDITERKRMERELLALKDGLAAEVMAMTRLHEFSTRLLTSAELQPVLHEILNAAMALQGADFGHIQLFNPDTLALEIVVQQGFRQEFLDYFGKVHAGTAACGRALQRRERVMIEDVQTDPDFEPHRPIAASAGFRAVQSTPLFSRSGEPLGMISTHFRQPHRPSERDLRLTDLYARQAAEMIERRRAEETLHQSRRLGLRRSMELETIYRTAPVGLCAVGARFQFLRLNMRLAEMIGLQPSGCIGHSLREVMPGFADALEPICKQVMQTGRPIFDLEVRGTPKADSGGERIWRTSYFPILGGTRKIIGVNVVVYDITAHKQAEETLRASEERFRRYFELGVIGMAITSPAKGILEVNDELCRVLGYERGELLQKTWVEMTHPDDLAAEIADFDRVMGGEMDGYSLDKRWIRKDGQVIDSIMATKCVRHADGSADYFVGLVRDITIRKRLEQELERERDRLRLLLDLTSKVVSSLDLRGVFQTVSASLRRFAQSAAAMLLLPDSERRQLRLFALDLGEGRGFLREDMRFPVEGSRLGQVFGSGTPRVLEDPDPAMHDQELLRATSAEGVQSSCALPLINRNRAIGVLVLCRKEGTPFIQADVEFLLQCAAQVAIAVENALDYHQVIQASERLAEERLYLQDEIRTEYSFEEMVGESVVLKGVLKQVEQVAPTDSTVLILGETGSGKERVARAIHDGSGRRDKSFIKLNCAAIPLGLLESELFGHERGAFTGAISRKIGRFELAHQGTLFLDEVGDIPLELQPKLLRVLQDQEFERLGSTRTQRVDVRLVAATNRDLAQMIADRQFRNDLFYRLNVFPIRVPPLRDRPEDIPPLVRHFTSLYARRMNKRIDTISGEDMEALRRYPWPGNVRELQNFIERAVILSPDHVLRIPLSELTQPAGRPPAPERTLEDAEREHILQALQKTNGVIGGPKGAATRLGLKRTTLHYKMERLGILRRAR